MSKDSIRSEIRQLQREIESLEKNKISYENMNVNINKAIDELKSANKYIKGTYQSLAYHYQSETSYAKIAELEDEYENISNVITILESQILVASNNKISDIKKSIKRKQNEISGLRAELRSMDD